MPGFYCDEAEDRTYLNPPCKVCGETILIEMIGEYGMEQICPWCGKVQLTKEANDRRKAYEIALENEKRARGGG